MKKSLVAAILAGSALVLAGCDGAGSPAGVGTGTREASSSGVSEELARERALEIARQQGTAQQVQLAGLILEAVQVYRPRLHGSFHPSMDANVCILASEPERREEFAEFISEDIGQPITPDSGLWIFVTGEERDFYAACVAALWAETMQPRMGWPSSGERMFSHKEYLKYSVWGAEQLGFALAASQAMAPIANSLAAMPGASIDDLKGRAQEMLLGRAREIHEATEATMMEFSQLSSSVMLDFGGGSSAPIHLTLGNYDLQIGPAGPLVTHHGTTRFGSGYLESSVYTVEAVTTSGQSMARRSTSSTSSDTATTTSATAEARTQ